MEPSTHVAPEDYAKRPSTMQSLLGFMDRLDRLGYVAAE